MSWRNGSARNAEDPDAALAGYEAARKPRATGCSSFPAPRSASRSSTRIGTAFSANSSFYAARFDDRRHLRLDLSL